MKKNLFIVLSLLVFFSTFLPFETANAIERDNGEIEYNVLSENDFVPTEELVPTEESVRVKRGIKDGSDAFELGFIIANGLFNKNTTAWHQGNLDFPAESIVAHYVKHGKEVGATSAADYLNKSIEYRRTVKKGVKPSKVDGFVYGVERWRKNGKYIDLAPDGRIVSFGTN